MTHNDKDITNDELIEFLSSIGPYLDDPVNMYALGGTALTLLELKTSTRDIDLNLKTKQEHQHITKLFIKLGFQKLSAIRWMSQEGIIFDLFYGQEIMGTHLLADTLKKAKKIISIQNISLYTLSLEDIIISKLARGDTRDFQDIKTILLKEKISLNKLITRYKKTMENSAVANHKQKILDLLEIKMKDWKMPVSKKLLQKVHSWDEN